MSIITPLNSIPLYFTMSLLYYLLHYLLHHLLHYFTTTYTTSLTTSYTTSLPITPPLILPLTLLYLDVFCTLLYWIAEQKHTETSLRVTSLLKWPCIIHNWSRWLTLPLFPPNILSPFSSSLFLPYFSFTSHTRYISDFFFPLHLALLPFLIFNFLTQFPLFYPPFLSLPNTLITSYLTAHTPSPPPLTLISHHSYTFSTTTHTHFSPLTYLLYHLSYSYLTTRTLSPPPLILISHHSHTFSTTTHTHFSPLIHLPHHHSYSYLTTHTLSPPPLILISHHSHTFSTTTQGIAASLRTLIIASFRAPATQLVMALLNKLNPTAQVSLLYWDIVRYSKIKCSVLRCSNT